MPDDEVERVLVICAHPDDVDFGAAGTVATWTELGVHVTYCIVTDGDAGGFDPSVSRTEIGPLRRREQTAAAAEVGVKDLVFLGHRDGQVESGLPLRRDLSRVIRQVRPQRVLTQSSERNLARIYASHPDHLAVGESALCAVYPDARNPFTFSELVSEEGLDAWTVPEVWVMGGPDADHAVDVTDQAERKISALRQHRSQHANPDGMAERVRGWMTATAAQFGLGDGRMAEAFRIVDTK